MTENERHREIGVGLQKKYAKIDLTHHFANCNIEDPVALGKMAEAESNMYGKMLEKSYWGLIGGKLQEL